MVEWRAAVQRLEAAVLGDSYEPLSERELEILRLVVTGVTNRQVAARLAISPNTVKVHLRNIFAKLGTQSRTEAALVAIKSGWVEVAAVPSAGAQIAPMLVPLSWRRRAFLVVALAGALLLALWPQRARRAMERGDALSDSGPAAGAPADPDTVQRWAARAPLAAARDRLACVSFDGRIYAIGGATANGIVNDLEVYDPAQDTWERREPKPTAASNVAAAVLGGEIYVLGGYGSDGRPLSSVEVYRPSANSWRTVAALPAPRCAYALAAAGGRLYLFGGWDGTRYVADVLIYDPEQEAWSYGTPLGEARGFAAAATVDGRIYVVGGYDGADESAACEVYDPASEGGEEPPWEVLAPLAQPRGGLGLAVAGNRLYAIGGGWNGGLAFNESYDVASNRWQPFPTPILGQWRTLGVAAVENSLGTTLFAVGGWTNDRVSINQAYRALWNIYLPALP